ncbi:TRAP transporter large permease subunit [Martelella endophytica]|uniref:TRAP transporter large permease subunit n=1 Tax=Martelella endophytica TaxID=1486262 RepID=UPI000A4BC34C|nr:TRAP transporter large permease subunit [Martelella endophytica]
MPYSFVASCTMSAVPMFLLMGFVAFHSGLTGRLICRHQAGAAPPVPIFSCSGFTAVSGSSLAYAAAMAGRESCNILQHVCNCRAKRLAFNDRSTRRSTLPGCHSNSRNGKA